MMDQFSTFRVGVSINDDNYDDDDDEPVQHFRVGFSVQDDRVMMPSEWVSILMVTIIVKTMVMMDQLGDNE